MALEPATVEKLQFLALVRWLFQPQRLLLAINLSPVLTSGVFSTNSYTHINSFSFFVFNPERTHQVHCQVETYASAVSTMYTFKV